MNRVFSPTRNLDYSIYLHSHHRLSKYYIAKDGVYAASLPGSGRGVSNWNPLINQFEIMLFSELAQIATVQHF